MEISKTNSNAYAESPWVIRPGSNCDLRIIYTAVDQFTWDGASIFSKTYDGFIMHGSIQSEPIIPVENIDLKIEDDGKYTLTLNPSVSSPVSVSVYIRKDVIKTFTTKSALSLDEQIYYQDYVVKDGTVIPKTIIEIDDIDSEYEVYSIENLTLVSKQENQGIEFRDVLFTITNSGLFKYNDNEINILRKGKEKLSVPLDYDGPYLNIENGKKIVEIDNQEWQLGYEETRGILLYENYLIIMTNNGICVYYIYGDFLSPDLINTGITGTDLTLFPDDTIGVANGLVIKKYKIKHDFAIVDESEKRIYFREKDTEIQINFA